MFGFLPPDDDRLHASVLLVKDGWVRSSAADEAPPAVPKPPWTTWQTTSITT
jgi:hypothetical protein